MFIEDYNTIVLIQTYNTKQYNNELEILVAKQLINRLSEEIHVLALLIESKRILICWGSAGVIGTLSLKCVVKTSRLKPGAIFTNDFHYLWWILES